ncbi:hypothetical protein OOZ19_09705 [Saccharopolyspora sp. NFXS83]|uniref:hypothetical protein n=1 Tax=Saccharopolyspora sp. NFXS83 TaxID=2993560 RepID=UPI00224A53EF|nr:hypothetical protein [Saccharopolyspora sp. NFXS83]MCX2730516.1 hypothetical protein [Saccharopolyspora sp. NFXS83]
MGLLVASVCGIALIAAPLVWAVTAQRPSSVPAGLGAPAQPGPAEHAGSLPAGPANLDARGRLALVARQADGSVGLKYQRESDRGQWDGWYAIGRGAAGDVVTAQDSRGGMGAFLIDTGGALQFAAEAGPESPRPAEWTDLGGTDLRGTPAASRNADGRFVVVARDSGGRLHETHQVGDGWSDLRELAGPPVDGDPVLRQDNQQRLNLFALDGEQRLRVQRESVPGEWEPARPVGERFAGRPSVVVDWDGKQRVYVRGTDGGVQEMVETEAGSGRWADSTELSGDAPAKGDPIATVDPNSTVVVFAVAEDGSVHERFIGPKKKRWTEWRPLDGQVERLLAAVQDGGGTLVVLGIGKTGSMEQNYQSSGPAPWEGWQHGLGGRFAPR